MEYFIILWEWVGVSRTLLGCIYRICDSDDGGDDDDDDDGNYDHDYNNYYKIIQFTWP